jgi:hypothetical protein
MVAPERVPANNITGIQVKVYNGCGGNSEFDGSLLAVRALLAQAQSNCFCSWRGRFIAQGAIRMIRSFRRIRSDL